MESSSDDSDLVESSRAWARGATAAADTSSDAANAKDDGAVRSALQYAVGRICEQEEDDDPDVGARMSSNAVASLAELVYQYATTSLANDLVAFSQHAGRKTVNVEDVKLAIRKDKKTHDSLSRFCERKGLASSTTSSGVAKGRKKKKAPAKAASSAKKSKAAKSGGKAGTSSKRKGKNEERRQELRDHINATSSSGDSDSMEPSGDDGSSDDDDSCLGSLKTPNRKKPGSSAHGIGGAKKSDTENDTTDGADSDDMVIDLASD